MLVVLLLLTRLFSSTPVGPLDTEGAAAYLKVSPRFLRQLAAEGEISYIRAGRKLLRFTVEDLDAWLHRGRVEAGAVRREA